MMPIDNQINLLKNIQPVDPPPFLLAKIKHRMSNTITETVPFQWKLTFCIVGILLILINIKRSVIPRYFDAVQFIVMG